MIHSVDGSFPAWRAVFVTFGLTVCVQAQPTLRRVAAWKLPHVATLTGARDLPGASGPVVLGTTFGPFGTDNIFALTSLPKRQAAQMVTISNEFKWPNELAAVPTEVGLEGSHLAVADGFLFPGKRSGGVHLLNVSQGLEHPVATQLTETKDYWFYHHTEWFDVDGDGLRDLLAARATKPFIFGGPDAELVWVKNLGAGRWGTTEVLIHGPGVSFHVTRFGDGTLPEIVATEFFKDHTLAIYSCSQATWAACGQSGKYKKSILDDQEGPFFASQIVDLNGDGKPEILATSQQAKTVDGRVLAYELKEGGDGRDSASWTRHVLADGFRPRPKEPSGSGSPGSAQAFISDAAVGGKPHIIFSGDDGGFVDILVPTSQSASDWIYEKRSVYQTDKKTQQGVCTIGTVYAADIDGTGKPEVFVASYAEDQLLMFTFDAPKETGHSETYTFV